MHLLVPFSQLPYNSLVWAWGSITVGAFGLRSLGVYKQTRNIVSLYYGWFCIGAAIDMAFYGWPMLFTRNPAISGVCLVVGSVFFYLAFLTQARLLWFLAFRNKFAFPYLLIPVIVLALIGIISQALSGSVRFKSHLMVYHFGNITGYMYAALLFALVVPVGVLFVRLGLKQRDKIAKTRYLIYGMVPIVAGTTVAISDMVYHGSETMTAVVLNLISYTMVGFAMLLPPEQREVPVIPEATARQSS